MLYRRNLICFFFIAISGLLPTPSSADDFTLGLKAWSASLSAPNLDGEDNVFPGVYLSWHLNERIWVSTGYIEGEVPFRIKGLDASPQASIEEVDWDFVMGWSFEYIEIGVGYRFAEFDTVLRGSSFKTESEGPMVHLGGSSLLGRSSWGYYWGLAYMFDDLEASDGSQTHFNGEVGVFWASEYDFALLFGFRYKEYSGDGNGGVSYGGPVLNLSFNF